MRNNFRHFCGSQQTSLKLLRRQGSSLMKGNYVVQPSKFSNILTATVFGAYGSSGRYIMEEIGNSTARAYVPFRGCEMEVRHLKPMFELGQLGLLPFSPRDDESIKTALRNSDVVINLIGKHYETKHIVPTRRADGRLCRVNYDFDEVHAEIPRKIARLAKEAGVSCMIHVSALAADLDSTSKWSRSKAKGELAVREEFPDAIIVKPATNFGPEDRFLNWIALAADQFPVLPIINGGRTLVQPVYSCDVGKALMTIVNNFPEYKGKTFQLVGPDEYSYKEVYEFVTDVTTVRKRIVEVSDQLARLAGRGVEQGINPFFTEDMVNQLLEDVVAQEGVGYLGFSDLGIKPTSMDKVSFDFLHRYRPGGHFTKVEGYY